MAIIDPDKNFRILVENSPDLIMRLDREGTILFINHTLPEFTVEGVTGTKAYDYLFDEERQKYKQALEEVFSSGESRSLEVSSVGSTYWLARLIPLSTDKKVESALIIATDITRLKLSEKALLDSKEQLKTIMATVPTGIITTTPEGKILDVNDTACNIAGFESKEEFLKQYAPLQYKNPDDRKRFINMLEKNGEVLDFEVEFKQKNNILVWISVNAIKRTAADGSIFFISTFQDISKRKKAEKLLMESEARYRCLSEASFEGIIIHDKGTLLEVNKAAGKIFGYEPSEMVGENALDFVAPESREIIMQHIMSNYEEMYEAKGLRKDSSTFPVEIIGKSTIYQGKKARITAIRDITERKLAEKQLIESEERLQAILNHSAAAIYVKDLNGRYMLDKPLARTSV